MYCRHCGKEIPDKAVVCIGCGVLPNDGNNYCGKCGNITDSIDKKCAECGNKLIDGISINSDLDTIIKYYMNNTSGKRIIAGISVGVILFSICFGIAQTNTDNSNHVGNSRHVSNVNTQKIQDTSPVIKYSPVPSDVNTNVIDVKTSPNKTVYTIDINRPVNQDVLNTISQQYITKHDDNVFVLFKLQGDQTTWAESSVVGKKYNVKIFGKTEEMFRKENMFKPDPNKNLIGRWRDNGIIGGIVYLYQDRNEYYYETVFSDGSGRLGEKVRKVNSTKGEKYMMTKNPEMGGYILILPDGNLKISDRDSDLEGFINIAQKIN